MFLVIAFGNQLSYLPINQSMFWKSSGNLKRDVQYAIYSKHYRLTFCFSNKNVTCSRIQW